MRILHLGGLVVFLSCLLLSHRGWAQDKAKNEVQDATKRIKLLIERLASPNPAPVMDDPEFESVAKFPANYDRNRQVDVYLATQQLLAEGELALDLLLANPQDNRYSYTMHGVSDHNYSVSVACDLIAYRIILCFEGEMNVISRSQYIDYLPVTRDKTLAEWWQANKKRGLVTIQLEALDQQIKVMEKLDAATASAWHPEAEQYPRDIFNRLRDENVRTLKSIRAFVAANGKPYRPKSLDSEYAKFSGLPWSRRHFNK
ncbi:hypothetical protein [Anatilimnocola floriformis]|uniref:hypothetical protein n=1 Tax=Anatilimnocola floriformis TaxID=2948575 RepID=UPI0020C481C8|nr:hypothetical protein [Anatilimnocola floriformis]